VKNAAHEIKLDRLREARKFAQVDIPQFFKINQSAVAVVKKRTGMYVSRLRSEIKAMGGELKITTEFLEGSFQIDRSGCVAKV
jgi:hypothetical protein